MIHTTTDGNEYITPDSCESCELDTGGGHNPKCPLYSVYKIWNNKEKDFNPVIKREMK